MRFVFQQLVAGLGEKAFKRIQMQIECGALVHIARAVDVDVAACFGQVVDLVVFEAVGFEQQIATAKLDMAFEHGLHIGATAQAVAL